MPVSYTKRVGQVGALFSSLFHLKYPKQCLVNSMKATVLAAKRILLHLPNAVNSFFFFSPRHFNQNNRKFSGRLHSFIFLMDAPWQIGSLIFIIPLASFLPWPTLTFASMNLKSISVYFIHDLLYSLVNSCILSPGPKGQGDLSVTSTVPSPKEAPTLL